MSVERQVRYDCGLLSISQMSARVITHWNATFAETGRTGTARTVYITCVWQLLINRDDDRWVYSHKIVKFNVTRNLHKVCCWTHSYIYTIIVILISLLCYFMYYVLQTMSLSTLLFGSYATIVLCIHHCKWVAHVNLSINGDDDDDGKLFMLLF